MTENRQSTDSYILNTPNVPACQRGIATHQSDRAIEEVSTSAAFSANTAVSVSTEASVNAAVRRSIPASNNKPTRPLPFGRTREVEQEADPEATADASAPIPYTSGLDSATKRRPIVPVHQGKRSSIVPVYQGKRLSASDPLLQGPFNQPPRFLQIHYEIPAGVDPVPGSPGTVLIPLQVENLSKKCKVRFQLAGRTQNSSFPSQIPVLSQLPGPSQPLILQTPRPISPVLSEASSTELPDAPPPRLLTYHYPDNTSHGERMSARDTSLKRRELSPTGSLSEYDDIPEQLYRPPQAIRATQSEAAYGKQPTRSATSQYDPLAHHRYRQPSAIPSSEEDDVMEGITHHVVESAPDRTDSRSAMIVTKKHTMPPLPLQQHAPRQQSPAAPQPQQHVFMQQLPSALQPQQYAPTMQQSPSTPQPQQYVPMQQSPSTPQPQQYVPMQQSPSAPQSQQYIPMQQSPYAPQPQQPQQYLPLQQPQQYLPPQQPQQYLSPQQPQQYLPPQQPKQYFAPQQYTQQLHFPQQSQSSTSLDNIAAQMAFKSIRKKKNCVLSVRTH